MHAMMSASALPLPGGPGHGALQDEGDHAQLQLPRIHVTSLSPAPAGPVSALQPPTLL